MKPHCLLLLPVILAACSTPRQPAASFGTFASALAAADTEQLAHDAAERIGIACPPASTRIQFQQPTQDAFGIALVSLLRGKGYAVLEPAPLNSKEATQLDSSDSEKATHLELAGPNLISLNYVVDPVVNSNLYRLKLLVGEHNYSRAYLQQNNTLRPAGAWVNQE